MGSAIKHSFCLGFLPFLIGLNKRPFPASSLVIHILGSGWHLCVYGKFFMCVLVAVVYVLLPVCDFVFGLQFESHPTAFFDGLHPHGHCYDRLRSLFHSVAFFYSLSCHESF